MLIKINGEIGSWEINSKDIISQINKADGNITVEISSAGGSVFEGIEIFNALKAYDKGEVIVVITSFAASIASYIALAGDQIKVYDNAVFMIHNAWTYSAGNHHSLRKTADVLEGLSSIMNKKYVSKTKKNSNEIAVLMDEESYFYGDEIVSFGFADEIIDTEEELIKNEAIALGKEKFSACNKNIKENFNNDEFVQAAAKLTKDGFFASVQDNDEDLEKKVADDAEHKNRLRELEIMNKGMTI